MKPVCLGLLLCAFATAPAVAQITITSSDLAAMYAVGRSSTTHLDTLVTSVNIGSPGGGNTWNFSSLASHQQGTFTSVTPAGTPFAPQFPSATHCFRTTYAASSVYVYAVLGTAFTDLGNAAVVPGSSDTVVSRITPGAVQFQSPMTFNSTWTGTYTEALEVNGSPLFSSDVTRTFTVDAYGSMTVPGGATYEALRLKDVEDSEGFASVTYIFFAKNGALVSLTATSDAPPSSGAIDVEDAFFQTPLLATDVAGSDHLPSGFALDQNYPNPFNPSTTITYSLPTHSHVTLTVFNTLGQQVAMLQNGEIDAGYHGVTFDGGALPSGVYFYRLQAGSYVETKKLTLMR